MAPRKGRIFRNGSVNSIQTQGSSTGFREMNNSIKAIVLEAHDLPAAAVLFQWQLEGLELSWI